MTELRTARDTIIDNAIRIQRPSEFRTKLWDLGNDSPLITTSHSILGKAKDSPLFKLSSSVLDHTQELSSMELGSLITTQDAKPWIITSEPAIEEPIVEEKLSKIHEELACVNKTINEMRHESKKKDAIIEQQQKENTKLKAQLKKEKMKNKSKDETIEVQEIELDDQQSQIDKLERRMNEAEDVLNIKREGI
jgi:hypothetical protein